jgi:cell division protease FtsH
MTQISRRLDFNPNDQTQLSLLFRDLREMTTLSDCDMPNIDLDKDIGGYTEVKDKMRKDILELLSYKDSLTDINQINQIEKIIPKGMLFVGPPGTGKTFFAKAMATSLNATVSIVSGPELKSKWVGESEENLRNVFAKARRSAPSIIIFDEIDSFATTRGTYASSGVEHSMVNQLLTEMDGFRSEELVFVIGTTNFPESLDPALLRPGRFELSIEIPYPKDSDRKAILEIYRKKFDLKLDDSLLEFLVKRTGSYVDEKSGVRYSGDHLYAICRSLKRESVRMQESYRKQDKSMEGWKLTQDDCVKALSKKTEKTLSFTPEEEKTVAIHESGHALIATFCDKAGQIERVTIATGEETMLGYVLRGSRENKYVIRKKDLLDDICILFGGRVAEEVCLDDISIGSGSDLQRATEVARRMVEEFGMEDEVGLRVYVSPTSNGEIKRDVSDNSANTLDVAIQNLLNAQLGRARDMIKTHKAKLLELSNLLLEKKTLSKEEVDQVLKGEKS